MYSIYEYFPQRIQTNICKKKNFFKLINLHITEQFILIDIAAGELADFWVHSILAV